MLRFTDGSKGSSVVCFLPTALQVVAVPHPTAWNCGVICHRQVMCSYGASHLSRGKSKCLGLVRFMRYFSLSCTLQTPRHPVGSRGVFQLWVRPEIFLQGLPFFCAPGDEGPVQDQAAQGGEEGEEGQELCGGQDGMKQEAVDEAAGQEPGHNAQHGDHQGHRLLAGVGFRQPIQTGPLEAADHAQEAAQQAQKAGKHRHQERIHRLTAVGQGQSQAGDHGYGNHQDIVEPELCQENLPGGQGQGLENPDALALQGHRGGGDAGAAH